MAFPAEILKVGIGIADSLTKGVQSTISHEAWIATNSYNVDTFAAPIDRVCVIDYDTKQMVNSKGESVAAFATLTFVGDVPPNGAAGRIEPFDTRDRITLPGGRTGEIISAPGAVLDPSTGRGLIHVVSLGAR